MNNSLTLAERVASASHKLTPTERRIADVILSDATVLAFGTVAEVAEMVQTSGPSVVRFATKLGFDGYSSLQQDARRLLSEHLKRPTDRIRHQHDEDVWERTRTDAVDGVEAAFGSVAAETVQRMASMIVATTGRVWIVGSESSAAALVLANGLRLLRPGVHHLVGSAVAVSADLMDATADDVAVTIDFSRYETAVTHAAKVLSDVGATVLAITDGAFSPIATLADVWCEVDVPAIGPFDSALPATAIAEAILAMVARDVSADATSRIDRAEALWAEVQIFQSSVPTTGN